MKDHGSGSPLGGLAVLRDARTRRQSSYDRAGGNRDCRRIRAQETLTIGDIRGAGVIRHIWFTISCNADEHYLRKLVLRMYWDGEKNPSVECPVGDFFGVGHAVANHFVSLPLNMVRGPGRGQNAGMNCYFPMPFGDGARITITNECRCPVPDFFYYIDYEEWDRVPEDAGRFHAHWRRECLAKPVKHKDPRNEINIDGEENYLIADIRGQGHYVGTVLSVDNVGCYTQNYIWWGEGDDMFFVDGERWPPSLHGTGTEDYFCSAWGFPSGEYAGPYHGVSLGRDTEDYSGRWTVYRFHIEDPIRFKKSLRATIEHGHANDQGNDYSSVAYWYQREPHKRFPKLLPVEKRLPLARHQ
jgi:hypothetical protein